MFVHRMIFMLPIPGITMIVESYLQMPKTLSQLKLQNIKMKIMLILNCVPYSKLIQHACGHQSIWKTNTKIIGGALLKRKELLSNIVKTYKNDVILLSSPGIANIVVFRSHANSILRVQELQTDDIDDSIDIVAKAVVSDIKCVQKDKDLYNSRIDIHEAKSKVSPTLSNCYQ